MKNFQTLIIIGLVIVIFLLRECKGESKGAPIEPVTIVKIETKYDTIVETVETYIPEYRTKVTYAYTDTLKTDSVTFVINDTISQNKILSRGINYSLIYPTTIITTEREINKRELYIGFGLGGDKQQLSYVGSELLLRNKKQRIYGIGLGINNSFEPILTFKMSWKVKFPKKPKITIPIGIDPTIE